MSVLSEFSKTAVRISIWIVGFAALGGGAYGLLVTGGHPLGFLRGALTGALISLAIAPVEMALLRTRLSRLARNLPFAIVLVGKSAFYLAAFVAGTALAEAAVPGTGHDRPESAVLGMMPQDLVFASCMAIAVNFILSVNRLLGQGVLASFITGRYHRPRLETRIFLMLDMVESTRIAERIGDIAFHRLLDRFIGDLGRVLVEHKGKIHKYVGDEIIVTWELDRGLSDARCIRGCMEARAFLEREGESYIRRFGIRPRFRAALHCGPVVSGEMGDLKQEIVFLGDAMNTTARIEQACRETGHDILASRDLIDRVALPQGIRATAIGPVALRGKEQPIDLFVLDDRPAGAAAP